MNMHCCAPRSGSKHPNYQHASPIGLQDGRSSPGRVVPCSCWWLTPSAEPLGFGWGRLESV